MNSDIWTIFLWWWWMPGYLADKLHVSRYWNFRKYLQQNNFLADWLRREFQSLMQVLYLIFLHFFYITWSP